MQDPFAAVAAASGPITTDDFNELLGRAGRVNGPALLFDAWIGRKISQETLAAHIGPVWSGAEYPDRAVDRGSWRAMFRRAGFTVDGVPATRPDEPIRLWRGSVPARRRDWSWTTERAIAEGYAAGTAARRPNGLIYTVLAPPAALLCANPTERNEAEFVIDTRGLRIHEAPSAAAA
ncbi:hypothetical protein AB0N09_21705 [Streptomyces erythrochromogenes]|uniref:hypothetical protein n=1 Tax=Streptomyces erythrochromogenes TaxID=285574 RepID=UPI003439B3F5